MLLALALFIALPTFLAGLIPGLDGHYTAKSAVEGLVKIAIFLVYLALVARMKEIKRLFSYHGAEHKTIFCYEKGLPLTVENVRPQSRFPPALRHELPARRHNPRPFRGALYPRGQRVPAHGPEAADAAVVIALAYEINRWAAGTRTT